MKRLLTLLLACLTTTFVVRAQDRLMLKKEIGQPQLLPKTNTLKWITTKNDFKQEDLSVAAIDEKIKEILDAQKGKAVADIECPINLKKLKYYGYQDFANLRLTKPDILTTTEYKDAGGLRNIFSYGNLVILSTYNAKKDQLYVYSVIRAFLILENKYPIIYKRLFQETEQAPTNKKLFTKTFTDATGMSLNTNAAYVVSIHENNASTLPVTSTYYGPVLYNMPLVSTANKDNYTLSDNVHFMFFNKATIANGGAGSGYANIYKDADAVDRSLKYLFDGLVQSIVHERVHNYIANYQTINKLCDYVRNNDEFLLGSPDTTLKTAQDRTYKYIEEPLVTNTVYYLFDGQGGLSKEVQEYYLLLFRNSQIVNAQKEIKFAELKNKLKELNGVQVANATEVEKIFRLYFD